MNYLHQHPKGSNDGCPLCQDLRGFGEEPKEAPGIRAVTVALWAVFGFALWKAINGAVKDYDRF